MFRGEGEGMQQIPGAPFADVLAFSSPGGALRAGGGLQQDRQVLLHEGPGRLLPGQRPGLVRRLASRSQAVGLLLQVNIASDRECRPTQPSVDMCVLVVNRRRCTVLRESISDSVSFPPMQAQVNFLYWHPVSVLARLQRSRGFLSLVCFLVS